MSSAGAAKPGHQPAGPATVTGTLGLYELRSGDVLAGRFRIESMLGVGGMGMVYRAFDQSLGVAVAIKLLRPELARRPEAFERFRQELLLARQVSSPNVVRIHDIAEHEGRWFISMDFIDGESLEGYLDNNRMVALDKALGITHDLLDGLSAAQQRGVVHRDLKPANILLDATGRAYITDFGVARSLGATGVTQSGVIIGTPEYLSPEQARGEAVDARSDLYAVGLIVYEMLAGALPFRAGTPAETVMQRIVRAPPSLAKARPDLPHWLHTFVDRLLKLNPAHRFSSPQEAMRALETRRVPRLPLNRTLILAVILIAVALLGIEEWVRRSPAPAIAVAPIAVTPQWAIVPFSAPDGEDVWVARAIEEHLHAWMRTDPGIATIPRRRMMQAIARTAPDAHGAALVRLLPTVAGEVNSTRMLHAELGRDAAGLTLHLTIETPGAAPSSLAVSGVDAKALVASYLEKVPAFLAQAGIAVGQAPPVPVDALAALGHGLSDLDSQQFAAAVQDMAALKSLAPTNALVAAALLRSDAESAQLDTQNLRDEIIKDYAKDASPLGSELYAQALAGDGQDEKAARALAQAAQHFPNDPALLLANADALRQSGAGDKAIAILKEYVKTADDDARAWFVLGRTAIEQGKSADAVEEYLLHAQTLNTLARDSAAEAETRNAIGIGYEHLGQLDAAAEQYQRAVAIRERNDDRNGLAKSLRNLAIVQAELGKRSDAEQTLTRAGNLLEALGDRASIADLYNDRGVVAEEAGDFAEALNFYRQAYGLRQQLDDPALVGESLNNIGYCSYRMGDFDNASVYWKQALAQYQKLGDHTRELAIRQNMALLDIAHGQFAAARKGLDVSLADAEQHQLSEVAAVTNVSLAELSLLEGRYSGAQGAIEQASLIYARRADERGQAEAALLDARLAIALGDVDAATKRLQAIDEKQLNGEQDAEFQLAAARRAALSGDLKERGARLDAALDAANKSHSGALALRVNLEQIRLALASNDTARAGRLLAAVSAQTMRLNEVPLRLWWIELETALALRNGKNADAAAHYREALPLLKTTGRFSDASILHSLGAAAFAADKAGAAVAQAAADASRKELLADAPSESRAAMTAELARNWRELSGRNDPN